MSNRNLYDDSTPIGSCPSEGGCDPSDCASCTGGCGGNGGEFPTSISLTLDDDSEVTCSILTIFTVEGKEYIALLPLTNETSSDKMDLNASFDEDGEPVDAFVSADETGEATGEVWLFKFERGEDGSPMLDNIEDDEEYMLAGQMFEQVMENARAQQMES